MRAARTTESAEAEPGNPPVEPEVNRPDVEGLYRWLQSRLDHGEIGALIVWVVGFIVKLWDLLAALQSELQKGKRGNPRSERNSALQAELPGMFGTPANHHPSNAATDSGAAVEESAKGSTDGPTKDSTRDTKGRSLRNRDSHGRPELDPKLPRTVRSVQVPATQRSCPCCATQMAPYDIEVSERIERVPAHLLVERTEREILRCPRCVDRRVLAPVPPAIVPRGLLGEDLLVTALVDHYRDAVPFERMHRDAVAQGFPLAANTLAKSVGTFLDQLDPIVQHILEQCMLSEHLGVDATSMPVLDPELPRGIRKGFLWHLLGDHRWGFFGYAPTGEDHHLAKMAKTSEAELMMSDGSATHNVLHGVGRVRAGCHSHARSKIVAAVRAGDARAVHGLVLYAPLFRIEAQSKLAGDTADQRYERRQRESVEPLKALKAWVDQSFEEVEPKSPLGQAVRYMKRQWSRLSAFVDEGRLDLTNNEIERDLRTWVLDRKSWLFCGTETSAKRASAALTILVTCSKFSIDPRRYLRDIAQAIVAGTIDWKTFYPERYKPSG